MNIVCLLVFALMGLTRYWFLSESRILLKSWFYIAYSAIKFIIISIFSSSFICLINAYIELRRGTTLCTRHAYSKYIIDNRMFTIQFENGFWSENISLIKILKLNVNLSSCLSLFSIWDLLKCMIAILVYKYWVLSTILV